jgi:hypothetical protein
VSRYIDINQLLEQIGASGRSASDPWSLSRSSGGDVSGTPSTPAVVADMGEPSQQLTSQIQSSERITQADIQSPSPTGGSSGGGSSSGGGILGGLLDFFPLASGIAKLFGFGGSSSPPALTPYELPPSINFEGAMTSPTSGVTSLSYGENGLPRTTGQTPTAASVPNVPTSNFTSSPAEELANIASPASTQSNATNTFADIASPSTGSTGGGSGPGDMVSQLGSLANSTFTPEPSAVSPSLSAGLVSQSSGPSSPVSTASDSGSTTGNGSTESGASSPKRPTRSKHSRTGSSHG